MTPALLACLVLSTVPPASEPAARTRRTVGLALAPVLPVLNGDAALLPVGVAVDWLPGPRWGVAASLATVPSEESISHYLIGGRGYLLAGALSPYLSADVGLERVSLEHGQKRRSPFMQAGVGLEWATPRGALFALDSSLGPACEDVGGGPCRWTLMIRTRVLLGIRF